MPPNKNKLLRMGVIVEMLRKKSFPNYTRFVNEMKLRDPAGAYKISDRTFRRDIEDLKTEFGAPIYYDDSELGYYLLDQEWYSEQLMVEPFEMKGVVLGQKMAESLMPEPLRSTIAKAVRSLLSRHNTGFSDAAELDMMQVINPMRLPLSADVFCTVFKAWEQRQKLRLTYCSVKGMPREMIYEPHVLAWQGGVWYLKGVWRGTPKQTYDKPYKTILAVHRILEAEKICSSFLSDRQLLATVQDGKLFEFERYPEVRLRFLASMAFAARERFSWQPGCVQESADGSLEVALYDLAEYEAVNLVLWARGEVTVLSPEPLRQEILRIAETMRQNQQA